MVIQMEDRKVSHQHHSMKAVDVISVTNVMMVKQKGMNGMSEKEGLSCLLSCLLSAFLQSGLEFRSKNKYRLRVLCTKQCPSMNRLKGEE